VLEIDTGTIQLENARARQCVSIAGAGVLHTDRRDLVVILDRSRWHHVVIFDTGRRNYAIIHMLVHIY
jgi:hypothetical protein